ncbi:MAG: hypothetical protein ACFB0C_03770 [Leptolyngbyaceae cyanobacterium]
MVLFVAGYTVTRVSLSQGNTDATADAAEIVIPHEAALWSGFAE